MLSVRINFAISGNNCRLYYLPPREVWETSRVRILDSQSLLEVLKQIKTFEDQDDMKCLFVFIGDESPI